jgi:hypothetical protein
MTEASGAADGMAEIAAAMASAITVEHIGKVAVEGMRAA